VCVCVLSQILGDQQAALVGQGCLKRGRAKNTLVSLVQFECIYFIYL